MENKLDLIGSDFSLEINKLEYDELCAADIEFLINLPVTEMKKIAYFSEKVIRENRNEGIWDKNFLITICELEEKIHKLELIGTNLTWSAPVHLINIDFEFGINIWAEKLTHKKLNELTKIQERTWLNSKADMSSQDISKIWEKKWNLTVEEMRSTNNEK